MDHSRRPAQGPSKYHSTEMTPTHDTNCLTPFFTTRKRENIQSGNAEENASTTAVLVTLCYKKLDCLFAGLENLPAEVGYIDLQPSSLLVSGLCFIRYGGAG